MPKDAVWCWRILDKDGTTLTVEGMKRRKVWETGTGILCGVSIGVLSFTSLFIPSSY
jgi:hypothetical protein